MNYTSNPTDLINEFVAYIQRKKEVPRRDEVRDIGEGNSTTLLRKFVGFLADTQNLNQEDVQGILIALKNALNIKRMHD